MTVFDYNPPLTNQYIYKCWSHIQLFCHQPIAIVLYSLMLTLINCNYSMSKIKTYLIGNYYRFELLKSID